MKTIEAFLGMINQRGIHNVLNMNSASVRTLRRRTNIGKHTSQDKMIELLKKAGYKIKSEMTWSK
jgi:hypothetical protein